MSVLKGDPDELALYNQAFEYIKVDIDQRLGEMERVIDSAGGLIDQFEANKDLTAMRGGILLEQYNQLGIEGMFEKFENRPIIMLENDRPTVQWGHGRVEDIQYMEVKNTGSDTDTESGSRQLTLKRNYFS